MVRSLLIFCYPDFTFTDLTTALNRKMPKNPDSGSYAKTIIERAGLGNAEITFADFVHYVLQKEKKLEVVFRGFDHNNDGFVDHREIRAYFATLGIQINEDEAQRILKKFDADGSIERLIFFQHYLEWIRMVTALLVLMNFALT